MRAVALLLLLLALVAGAIAQDAQPVATPAEPAAAVPATPAAATPAVATPAPTPAPAAAAPTPAPTPAAPSVDLSGVHSSLSSLESRLSALSDLHSSASTQVGSLLRSVESSLSKLHSAGEASHTAGEGLRARLDALERELAGVRKLVGELSAKLESATQSASSRSTEALVGEMRANQRALLERLANVSSGAGHWSFDPEALFHSAKNASFVYSARLTQMLQRGVVLLKENAPHWQARAEDALRHGADASQRAMVFASLQGREAQGRLAGLLASKGVPPEHVHVATMSILALIALVVLLCAIKVLRALCALLCCCCGCGRRAAAKKGADKKKKNKQSMSGAPVPSAQTQ